MPQLKIHFFSKFVAEIRKFSVAADGGFSVDINEKEMKIDLFFFFWKRHFDCSEKINLIELCIPRQKVLIKIYLKNSCYNVSISSTVMLYRVLMSKFSTKPKMAYSNGIKYKLSNLSYAKLNAEFEKIGTGKYFLLFCLFLKSWWHFFENLKLSWTLFYKEYWMPTPSWVPIRQFFFSFQPSIFG